MDVFGLARKPKKSRLPEGKKTGNYGPSSWKDDPSKIGQQSQDKSSGWRDDVLGHDFGEEKIGPHVNAWNNSEGIYSNLHLLH